MSENFIANTREARNTSQLLRIYIEETDRYHGRLLYEALLEMFKQEGIAGATVLRAVSGFGGHRQIHHDTLVDVLPQLPIVVEVVEQPVILARLRPQIEQMVTHGLITVQEVEIWKYSYRRPLPELPLNATVGQVMNRKVTSVQPDTSLAEVVQVLLDRNYFKALPVVDSQERLVGIITDHDLLERGELPLRLSLIETLNSDELDQLLRRLKTAGRTASDVMTTRVISVKSSTPLREAARIMVTKQFKRLPVVNDDDRLIGVLGRLDILRLVAQTQPHSTGEKAPEKPGISNARFARDLMDTDLPVVRPEMPLADLLDYMVASELQRVVVTDNQNHLLGIITDADLVERVSPEAQPGILRRLAHTFGLSKSDLGSDAVRTARDLMSTPVVSAGPDELLETIVQVMVEHGIKFLPIVDEQFRLLGAVRRTQILQVISDRLANN